MTDNYFIFKIILFVKIFQYLDNVFGKKRNVASFFENKIKHGLVEFCIFLSPSCVINSKLCFKINIFTTKVFDSVY